MAAIAGNQSLEIISKIVDKGGWISYRCVFEAIRRGRADVLEMLLNHKWNRLDGKEFNRFNAKDDEAIREQAQLSGDKEIIYIVEAWIQARTAKKRLAEKRKNVWWRKLLVRMLR